MGGRNEGKKVFCFALICFLFCFLSVCLVCLSVSSVCLVCIVCLSYLDM